MPNAHFNEMLRDRREQLGLTIEQASRVLKLKEQALIAFEEADFTSIPKSGYAQGMLSSYARYLGLNPREVVDQFQEDLYEHTNGVMSHELRKRTRDGVYGRGPLDTNSYDASLLGQRRTNRHLPAPPHLLPENPLLGRTASFDTTSPARSRSELYQQRSNANRTQNVTSSAAGLLGAGALGATGSLNPAGVTSSLTSRSYPQGRPYTGQSASAAYSSSRSRSSRPSRARANRARYAQGYGAEMQGNDQNIDDFSSNDIVQRGVSGQDYVDDLRIDNNASRYESASTRQGRQSFRNIASTKRPSVRRNNELGRQQLRARRAPQAPRKPGIAGFIQYIFADQRRLIFAIGVLVTVVLIAVLIFAVRSCAKKVTSDQKVVPIATADAGATKKNSSSESSSSAAGASTSSDTSSSSATPAAPTETTVKVKVDDGAVTWVEIENDGKSEVAQTITGPWERTYTVTKSITIQVGNTSVVHVTKNGENVRFEERSSGVGTLTIAGTAPADQGNSTGQTQDQQGGRQGAQGNQTQQSQQGQGNNNGQNQAQDGSSEQSGGEKQKPGSKKGKKAKTQNTNQ